jgi:hypothetical protein
MKSIRKTIETAEITAKTESNREKTRRVRKRTGEAELAGVDSEQLPGLGGAHLRQDSRRQKPEINRHRESGETVGVGSGRSEILSASPTPALFLEQRRKRREMGKHGVFSEREEN